MSNGYWEDIKNLFKSKQRLKEEEAQAVGEAVKQETAILGKLKELEAEYKASLKDDTPNFDEMFAPISLERVSYDKDTDEEIMQKAAAETDAKYLGKLSAIDAEAFDKALALSQQKEEATSKKNATLAEIEGLYESLKERVKDDGIRKGIQRGSIVDGQIDILNSDRAVDKKEAESEYLTAVKSVDGKLSILEKERNDALSELNLKKAVDLSESIAALEKQRETLIAGEAAKNNAIEKQEADQNAKLQKQKEAFKEDYYESKRESEKQQAAYEKKYGYSGAKQQNYADRYNIALEFYLNLDPDVAPKALAASGNMQYYLGYYYDTLMDVLEERASKKQNKYL